MRPRAIRVAQCGHRESLGDNLALDRNTVVEVAVIGILHDRLIIVGDIHIRVVGQVQPLVELDGTLCTEVVTVEVLVADTVDTVVAIVAARDVIGGTVGATADADVMLRREVGVTIELLEPVGIAKVVVVTIGIKALLLKVRIGIAYFQFLIPIVPAHPVLTELIVDL